MESSTQWYFSWSYPEKCAWRCKWHCRKNKRKYSKEAVVVNVRPADREIVTTVGISRGKRYQGIKWQQSKVAQKHSLICLKGLPRIKDKKDPG